MATTEKIAVELLKETAHNLSTRNLGGVLRRFVAEKDYDHDVVRKLAQHGLFGTMLESLVLRGNTRGDRAPVFNYFGKRIAEQQPDDQCITYNGSAFHNINIDGALSRSSAPIETRKFWGQGVAEQFVTGKNKVFDVQGTPIAVIGYGAAGHMVSAALYQIGLTNVKVFEKSKNSRGIWANEDVLYGSRNNPRLIDFLGQQLQPAPGSGEEVGQFLSNIAYFTPVRSEVTGIEYNGLGDIQLSTAQGQFSFPIVVNCMGLGKPRPISVPGKMTTDATDSQAGYRWQRKLELHDVKDKSFAFIGLGNSTMEMLNQIHAFEDKEGVEVNYRVFTHFPKEAVFNPDSTIEVEGKKFRVFRDVTASNLVDLQGDLFETRNSYFRALRNSRIVPDVASWHRTDGYITAFDSDEDEIESMYFDSLYTLIGYKQPKENLEKLGCIFKKQGICYDYDGEMTNSSANSYADERILKGLFGFGAVLDAPHNRNAIVIPGMNHRIGDLLFSVVMRAYEYNRTKL